MVPGTQCTCHRTCRVEFPAKVSKFFSSLHNFNLLTLYYFIADTPAYYGRVISITEHERLNVGVPPLINVFGIIKRFFLPTPSIKSFVNNEDSLTVTLVKKWRCRMIMARTNGIESSLLKHFNLVGFCSVIASCSDKSVITMYTRTSQQYRSII